MKKLFFILLCLYGNFVTANDFVRTVACVKNITQNPNKVTNRTILDGIPMEFEIIGYGVNGRTSNKIQVNPNVGIKFNDGWLLGHNHGEWGGVLAYRKFGKQKNILDENVIDIYEFDSGFIVLTGLVHMSFDEGNIYFVDKNNFKPIKIHALTSKPRDSWKGKDNSVHIKLNDQAVILSDKGTLTSVMCS